MRYSVSNSKGDLLPVIHHIGALLSAGKTAIVEVREHRPAKSDEQLAKIHAMTRDVNSVMDEPFEVTKTRVKDYLGYYRTIYRKDGTEIKDYLSWGDAKMAELSEWIDRLTVFCVENDIPMSEASRP